MSEVRLYSAPSHVLPSHIAEPHNNGNKSALCEKGGASDQVQSVCEPGHTVTVSAGGGGTLSRLCGRRSVLGSGATTIMGGGESRCSASDTKLTALFEHYRDREGSEDTILAEGIERLCADLQVSPDEFRVLVLAWKLNAEQMCRFTRTEFMQGCREMRVDSIRGIQARLPELVAELAVDPDLFKDLYRFTFRFGLDAAAGQRILPTDMAVCLWRLVFSVREPPILARWLSFLELHPQVRGIPRDTWNMFLNFSDAVGDDLSSYDDTEAWPSLFDDFVEYENDQMNQNISKAKESDSLLIKNEN